MADDLRSGWLTLGPRTAAFERAFAEHLGAQHAVAVSSCTAALHLAYLAAGVGPGDEVIVPSFTFAATAAAAVYCGADAGVRGHRSAPRPSLDPRTWSGASRPRTKAVCVVHFAGYAAAVDRMKALCDRHGIALIEDVAHAPSAASASANSAPGASPVRSASSRTRCSPSARAACCARTATMWPRSRAPSARTAMTSGTWDRHSGRTDTYDVVGTRLQLPPRRAALGAAAVAAGPPGAGNRAPPRADAPLPRAAGGHRGHHRPVPGRGDRDVVLLRDADHARAGPPMRRAGGRQGEISGKLRERGIQTSIFYPSIHRSRRTARAIRTSRCRSPSWRRAPS